MIDAPIGDTRSDIGETRSKWKPKWPAVEHYKIKIGEAKITREGEQLTVVSYGRHVLMCNKSPTI